MTLSEKSPSSASLSLSQRFQPSSARSSASVTAKGTSVRLVLRLSLAAMARHSRMSKGIWLLFLRLSGRTCARCSMSLCLFIVRMMSSIRLQQFVCVKFPDGSKKCRLSSRLGFSFAPLCCIISIGDELQEVKLWHFIQLSSSQK